jgi:hypothetical protein
MEGSMEQRTEPLSGDDVANLEWRRGWVRDHYDPAVRDRYATVEGKLRLLETILDNNLIGRSEIWKLQSLGIAFGDVLVQEMELAWVVVEDEYGRDPALEVPGTTIKVFPLTIISKRVEDDETVDVRELLAAVCETVAELKTELPHRTTH